MGAAGKLCMTHGAKEKRYRRLKPQKRIKRAIVEVGSPSTVRLKILTESLETVQFSL